MYNTKVLEQQFRGIVAFLPANDPSYTPLDPTLTASLTGVYVQRTHPLCTIENLENVAPEFSRYTYPVWNTAVNYAANTLVSYSGKIYRAAVENLAGSPAPGVTGDWVEINAFSSWLTDQYNSGIQKLFADLIRYKALYHSNRQLIDSLMLFDGLGRYADKIVKRGRMVGFSIKVASQEGLVATIDKVGAQMSGNGVVPMYLYHSTQTAPISQFDLVLDRDGSFQWLDGPPEGLLLSYIGEWSPEGQFYLAYYEDDLPAGVQAIRRESYWGMEPSLTCAFCSAWNHSSYMKWSKHLKLNAFWIQAGQWNADRTMFDENLIQYDPTTNWGLNLKVTVACDLTPFFLTNKLRFQDALAMSVCIKLLEQIGYTTRLNSIADQTKALALRDLSIEDKDSFYNKYVEEVKSLSLEFSGMSSDCMPCAKKGGIKMGAA
jgi:hypothetical protein